MIETIEIMAGEVLIVGGKRWTSRFTISLERPVKQDEYGFIEEREEEE